MKKRIRGLKRLLTATMVFVLVICGSNLTAFAGTSEDTAGGETLLICNKDGSVTYQTIPAQEQTEVDVDESDIVCDMDASESSMWHSKTDDQISTLAASSLDPVSLLSVTFAPYKYSCLIESAFPSGDTIASSGILVGKNIVLASGHGVYDSKRGGSATNVRVKVGAYYTSTGESKYQSGMYQKENIIIHKDWAENGLDKADWALITIPTTFDSYQKCGYASDYTRVMERKITLLGYPGKQFCCSKGQITGTTDYKWNEANKGLWTTSAQSDHGMSGGPAIDDETGAVIGVIKGKDTPIIGSNAVVPLTKVVIDAIKTYSK